MEDKEDEEQVGWLEPAGHTGVYSVAGVYRVV